VAFCNATGDNFIVVIFVNKLFCMFLIIARFWVVLDVLFVFVPRACGGWWSIGFVIVVAYLVDFSCVLEMIHSVSVDGAARVVRGVVSFAVGAFELFFWDDPPMLVCEVALGTLKAAWCGVAVAGRMAPRLASMTCVIILLFVCLVHSSWFIIIDLSVVTR
jgi:hypothetical protein